MNLTVSMNICIVSDCFFKPNSGGVSGYTYWAAMSLAARGHRILCVTTAAGSELPHADVELLYVDAADMQSRLAPAVVQHGSELIWLHALDPAMVHLCREAADAASCKLVCHLHVNPASVMVGYTDCLIGDWFDCCRGRRVGAFLSALLRYPLCYLKRCIQERCRFRSIYEQADALVLLSERFREEFCRVAGMPSAPKLRALPNPLLTSGGEPAQQKRKEVLYVGRLPWQHKRADRLLKAWQLLEKDFPDWQLTIVGYPETPRYEELSAELELRHVVFEGPQVPDGYYARAPIFCMTSSVEGFGMVLIEAQAAGCVPVAFDSYSSVHDIIEDGVNGCLVPPFDIRAYAETLRRLMSDEAKRAAMSEAARRTVLRFASARVVSQVENVFAQLLSKSSEPEKYVPAADA